MILKKKLKLNLTCRDKKENEKVLEKSKYFDIDASCCKIDLQIIMNHPHIKKQNAR